MADDQPLPQADAAHPVRLRQDHLRRVAPAVQHEINNAMMVLSANLDLLARSVGEGAPQRQLDRALQASRRLEETMRGFLDAARREVAETGPACLATALRQLLPLLRVALGARHSAEMVAPERLAPVRLDRAALEIALLAAVQEAAPRLPHGSRLSAALHEAEAEVLLELSLPDGLGEQPLALLRGCCARLELRPDGCLLAWAKG